MTSESVVAVQRHWVIDIPSADDSDWHFEFFAEFKKEDGISKVDVSWRCPTLGYKGTDTVTARQINWAVILRFWQRLQSIAYSHAYDWNCEDAPIDRGVLVIPEKKLSTIEG